MHEAIPIQCLGIIMDGNRRWAKEMQLPKLEGHQKGMDNIKTMARAVREATIPHLVVYAFSTENWNREESEVSYLLELFYTSVQKEMRDIGAEGIRIRFVGQLDRFSQKLQEAIGAVEKETALHDSMTLWICLSYGGRAEILEAARALASAGTEISEVSLSQHMWTAGMPDPDLIIRTGGDQRLSNFLTWQSVYSELFFTSTLWPAFTKEELNTILVEYASRERRRGK